MRTAVPLNLLTVPSFNLAPGNPKTFGTNLGVSNNRTFSLVENPVPYPSAGWRAWPVMGLVLNRNGNSSYNGGWANTPPDFSPLRNAPDPSNLQAQFQAAQSFLVFNAAISPVNLTY